MITKEKLKEVSEIAINENGGNDFDFTYDEETQRFVNFITQYFDLDFDLYLRNGNNYSWLQTEYFSNKIGKTIIWDYNTGNFDDADEIFDWIIRTEKEIKDFEELLPDLRN